MRWAGPDPTKWAYHDLAHNGWEFEQGDPATLGSEMVKAMKAVDVSTEKEKNPELTATLENEFPNFRNEMKVHKCCYNQSFL